MPPRPFLFLESGLTDETFIDALNRRCAARHDRRMRLRRSIYDHDLWYIEQKIDRSEEIPVDGNPDLITRVQDGYALVMQFYRQPVIACEQCSRDIVLPVMKHTDTRCEYCHARPESYAVNVIMGGYWPLCDTLIKHLEQTSYKMSDEVFAKLTAKNHAIKRDLVQRRRALAYDVGMDFRNQLGKIPSVGYGSGPASLQGS